jgi:hypothetical protein
LTGDVIRRRAVFHLIDCARPTEIHGYAVQKIAASGATHVPVTFARGA